MCLLGSEPRIDAEKEFLPEICLVNKTVVGDGNVALLTIDESKLPDGIKRRLGLG